MLRDVTNVVRPRPSPHKKVLRKWDEQRGTQVELLDERRVRKTFRRTPQRPDGWGFKQWAEEVRRHRSAHRAMRGSPDMYVPEVVDVRYDDANDEPQWLYMDMVRCPNNRPPLDARRRLKSSACVKLRRGLERLRRELGMIHGDLKPQNVLWNATQRRWCLLDFEIVYEAEHHPRSLGEGTQHEANYILHCANDDIREETTFSDEQVGMPPPRGYLLLGGGDALFLNARGPAA